MAISNTSIPSMMPKKVMSILNIGGNDFIKQVGLETVKQVVHDVLCGENLRDSTETITRKRITLANAGLTMMFLEGCKRIDSFMSKSPELAVAELRKGRLSKHEKWILNWILGLTDKAVQNILRDDPNNLLEYLKDFKRTLKEAASDCNKDYRDIIFEIVAKGNKQRLNWEQVLLLFSAVGAQTLTIRGSEKSTYGKLFERLILGSMLHILGFKFIVPEKNKSLNKIFWLSQRDEKRESDATLIYKPGKGVRFDIGFIGRGNSEISLDKVSRFEKEIEYGRQKHFMATFIIVDRIGANSRIYEMAKKIDGTIVQMSMGYWPKIVAQKLRDVVGLDHPLVNMSDNKVSEYILKQLKDAPFESFVAKQTN